MSEERNRILVRMLERLFAGLVSGPNLNCRPHSSRQRIDLTQLVKLKSTSAEDTILQLLGAGRSAKLMATVASPKRHSKSSDKRKAATAENPSQTQTPTDELTPEERAELDAWTSQQSLLGKLRIVAEEAKTYEQDTGVHVLNIGFPLLSLPPGSSGAIGSNSSRGGSKRILAPVAFIPVAITIRSGPSPTIEIACKGDEVDVVAPNAALLAWIEQQTGVAAKDSFNGDGEDSWREICSITEHVATLLKLELPAPFSSPSLEPAEWRLQAAPRSDEEDSQPRLVTAAVLGLFPMNNQSLLRDTQAMLGAEALKGPVESFVQAGLELDQPVDATFEHATEPGKRRGRVFAEERLVTSCDPCQARAVRLARECRGLVIHGPPGTGKSQTITNIIGDHLSRGERVLMVCDKRTALDVVANRLDHLGLGSLCALVHDPQRDQRDLYRAIREQLDQLSELKSTSAAERKLKKVDAELQKLHNELSSYWSLLMDKDTPEGSSFHELMGEWLGTPDFDGLGLDPAVLDSFDLSTFEDHEQDLEHVLGRAEELGYAGHGWKSCAGPDLAAFLSKPLDHWSAALNEVMTTARAADETADPRIPPFAAESDLVAQGQARAAIADEVQAIFRQIEPRALKRWASHDVSSVRRAQQELIDAGQHWERLRSGPLDPELSLAARADSLEMATINRQLAVIESYREVASKWYGMLFWKRRTIAAEVLTRYGLQLNDANAERLQAFLSGLKSRMVLQALRDTMTGTPAACATDDQLDSLLSSHQALLELVLKVHSEPTLGGIAAGLKAAMAKPELSAAFVAGLRGSASRSRALSALASTLRQSGLFREKWVDTLIGQLCNGVEAMPTFERLHADFDGLETVLRVQHEISELPRALHKAARHVVDRPIPAESGLAALHKAALSGAISARLKSQSLLQTLDAKRLETNLQRYRTLEQDKRSLVIETIVSRWVARQQERLLASTGSRLNGSGADLRRRLTIRGERAMRLRQVISVGQTIEGGDPLFDLRPLWMASPETVAQVFPRLSLFDVVIFDEASQCRLEEALPVLTRAGRVVIAGDPQQLPPTRFFESAVAVSEEEEAESDQQLFEAHQASVEDLLTAALGINIQQCYLDVHYRSRNADLVEFSNQQFYSSRLQPIPGHPSNRLRFAPITLYHTQGIYHERVNPIEAEHVCRIVHDLLKRAEPPSIGVACFNLAQRDLIVEQLEALATEDREFADRLSLARARRGESSFEGLFVKNLENVQGDERDHMIISTTYGPDPSGKFYRRFGPLGRAGGGRRLNVLVTRARQEVHLVTSIPQDVYRNIPEIPSGQAPTGGWLLFAYLAYAEQLAEVYEDAHQQITEVEAATLPPDTSVNVWPTSSPSPFVQHLADQLSGDHQLGSEVYWGNDGFCVDLAMRHPGRTDDVTIGILCDAARFSQAEDPLEWDLFRSAVLEGQGWQLHRIWSPHFFRDPRGCTRDVLRQAAEVVAKG